MSNNASASLPQSAKVFISYRREDSAGHAGWLFDEISRHFGDRITIFMDIDSIAPGEDFVGVIENAVGACDILVAVIGRNWLTITNENGERRLDKPEDFVRVEIATALNRNVRVIPVLVQGVTMPRPEQLPEALVKLTRRHAIELSDARRKYDVDRLIKAIEEVSSLQSSGSGKTKDQRRAEGLRMSRLWSRRIIAPVIGIGIILSIGLWLAFSPTNDNPNTVTENVTLRRLLNPGQLRVSIIRLEGTSAEQSERLKSDLVSAGCTNVTTTERPRNLFPESAAVRFYFTVDKQNAEYLSDHINKTLGILTQAKDDSTDRNASNHQPGDLNVYIR